MGRVRNKTVKRAAKVLIEKYYMKLTPDFHLNKKILSDVGEIPSKKIRNRIAGFATHLLKRIQKGPVKGISLKIQEEERERRLDFVPEKSKIDLENVEVNKEAKIMLQKIGMADLKVIDEAAKEQAQQAPARGERGERGERQQRRPVQQQQ